MLRWLRLLVLLGITACLDPEVPSLVTGEWGGAHLGLVATDQGADLEYDCALGRIDEAIRPDGGGHFTVTGVHFPGHGGPVPPGAEIEEHPARYTGVVRGDRMTLTVTLTDSDTNLGTFTLIRGASPYVLKCL
jgi:hypothetical protein